MKKLFLVSVLTAATALSGCAGFDTSKISAQVSAVEAEVQADANLVCGFIPTIATIAAIITTTTTVTATLDVSITLHHISTNHFITAFALLMPNGYFRSVRFSRGSR